jgi:RND family efflux transporter MFP subunit
MTFADTSSLQVDVDIPMRSRSLLVLGQSVRVSVDAIAGDLTATVSRIHPIADKIRHTIHIELALPQHPSLSAGMYAKIKIPSGSAASTGGTIKIPASAVVSRGGLSLVFLLNQENHAAIRMVRVGESSGQGNVEILSGLNNGDRIVLAPSNGLQSGDTVN